MAWNPFPYPDPAYQYTAASLEAAWPQLHGGERGIGLSAEFGPGPPGGPRLGDLFMGSLAAITTLWFPPVAGGILVVVIIGLLLRGQSTFRHYDALNPTS